MIGLRVEQTITSLRRNGVGRTLRLVRDRLKKEGGARVPIGERIWLGKNGFKPISYVLYGFSEKDKNTREDYLSERGSILLNQANGEAGRLLRNKLVFQRFLERAPHGCKLPKLRALIRRRQVISALPPHQVTTLAAILEQTDALFVKPIDGARGHGVRLIKREQASREPTDIVQSELIVVDRAEQATYSANISPACFNTVRIIGMRHAETREVFIPAAVHRFGTHETAPVDNFSQGGLSCAIDITTGRLGPGTTHPSLTGWKMKWFPTHPDTGIQLEGTTIPNWQALLDNIKELMDVFPDLEFAGWDMLPIDGGWCVIEGNDQMDIDLLQVHRGLLADERVRQFIAYHFPTALSAKNG